MATTIDDLVLRFSAQTEQLSRDLKKVERTTERSGKRAAKSTDRINTSLKKVSKSAKRAGAAMVAAFAGGAALRGLRQTFSAMNDLQTAADGLGVTVELIQELRFAFIKAGADASKVEKILTDFNKRIGEARSNLGTLLPFLKEFKIELDNVDGTLKTSDQLFDEVIDKVAGLEDNTAKAALSNAAFGRSWVQVNAATKDGAEAFAAVRKEARDTSNVLSGEMVEAAAAVDAQFNILLLTLGNFAKRETVTLAEFFGIIDIEKSGTQIQEQLDELVRRRDILTGKQEAREQGDAALFIGNLPAAIADANAKIVMLELNLANLSIGEDENAVATAKVSDAYKNLDHELNKLAVTMSKNEKVGIFAIDEGLKEMDKLIAGLDKKLIELGPAASDSIGLVANSFEEMVMNLGEADDAVKNLIASFGQLILKQFALKAATAVVGGFSFADGGVMTSSGPAPMKSYASGGIARTRQVAEFGEGSQPEAFVPLPDGRSIPVTMTGAGGSQGGGGTVVNQTNNFMSDVRRTVQAEILGLAPLLIEATKEAVFAESGGVNV